MDINNLRAFIEVADKRSFSKSAETLHLTQPAVSKRIAALESELCAKLFDRVGRRVHLTEAGNVLLPSARQISTELDRIEEVICNLGQSVTGKLSIATCSYIAVHYMAPLLKEFKQSFGNVEMDMHFHPGLQNASTIEEGVAEIGFFTSCGPLSEKLEETDIWSERLVVVAAPDHPLVSDAPPDFELLMKCPAVLPCRPAPTRTLIDHALSIHNGQISVSLEATDLATLKMMVTIGLGWGCLPENMVDDSVTVLNIPELEIYQKIALVKHRDRTLSRAAQAFIDVLPQCRYTPAEQTTRASLSNPGTS